MLANTVQRHRQMGVTFTTVVGGLWGLWGLPLRGGSDWGSGLGQGWVPKANLSGSSRACVAARGWATSCCSSFWGPPTSSFKSALVKTFFCRYSLLCMGLTPQVKLSAPVEKETETEQIEGKLHAWQRSKQDLQTQEEAARLQ